MLADMTSKKAIQSFSSALLAWCVTFHPTRQWSAYLSASSAVIVAGAPSRMYGDHTSYQKLLLELLHLHPLGHFGTAPDGNCLFNGISQCISGLSPSQVSQHKHQGQQHHARLWHEAADVLSADPILQRQMQDMTDYALNRFPGVTQQHALHPDIPLSQLVATAIRKDKQWAGIWVTKALAIALERNIMVISTHGSLMYFKSRSRHSRNSQAVPYAAYPAGVNTRRATTKYDVPIEALEAATCFVVWDGKGHYWAALRSAAPPTQEALTAQGYAVEATPKAA